MKRYAYTAMLKDNPEVIRQYEQYHRNVWPEVVEFGRTLGIRRVFIYRYGRQLFMFVETEGDFDLGRGRPEHITQSKVKEWDELMRGFQEPFPGSPEGSTWIEMKEVHALDHVVGKEIVG